MPHHRPKKRVGLLAPFWLALTVISSLAAQKPNIIVIFTDDHGYADLNCQGQRVDLKTPHLDRLAAHGMRCTSGYVTAPQCIPSRAGLLSGRHQSRFGLDHNGTIPMPLDEVLIPQRLQQAGYATGMVGKWHLDPNQRSVGWIRERMPDARISKGKPVKIPHKLIRPYLPDVRGFTDSFCGNINSYWANYDLQGKPITPARNIQAKGYRLDIQTDAALAFIDRHANKEPFFLYLAYFAPHVPLDATAQYLKRFPGEMPRRRKLALAMISAVDDGVGRIRAKLGEHKIHKDTLIFFISDNGAPLNLGMKDEPGNNGPGWDGSRNDPWVGEKGMLTEGGIRVPFIATWPGTIPAGKTYDHPVSSLDVGATAMALAGLAKPAELDGSNLIPYLTGRKSGAPHDMLFWRFWNQSAVRKGKWKYFQAGPRQFLFDLESPQHETVNCIDRHPGIARELQGALQVWAGQLKNPGVPGQPLHGSEKKWIDHYLPQ